ncbi:MAG TPA: hypothetical protein ENK07_07345, partial [Bacteroidetes bacterium]|nr:hypothetical protein [Bacteroidota bacterium]
MKRAEGQFLGFVLAGFLTATAVGLAAPDVLDPAVFLGYAVGERFTPHHRLVAYFERVAERSPRVRLEHYGHTAENRPLLVAFVGGSENIQKLDELAEGWRALASPEGTGKERARELAVRLPALV